MFHFYPLFTKDKYRKGNSKFKIQNSKFKIQNSKFKITLAERIDSQKKAQACKACAEAVR